MTAALTEPPGPVPPLIAETRGVNEEPPPPLLEQNVNPESEAISDLDRLAEMVEARGGVGLSGHGSLTASVIIQCAPELIAVARAVGEARVYLLDTGACPECGRLDDGAHSLSCYIAISLQRLAELDAKLADVRTDVD